ncbi:MFS transporter [Candidatus Cyrtobacter comes]|uniref:MFS transporter n=1 Tax=Candidatus Cyrtobacter comes TaxID=675776 RepID=A0ABU5L7H3_9RICK|nr:MFS transporter [Candidatus Cyrtobacter comes]MDZ5762074.1 MFS transporter [Candidatus Cyrtobacter comes]
MAQKRKIIGSTVVGNIVEYYDFGVYAVFAPTIGALFFPHHDGSTNDILALIVFAIGFLMRPLGGIIFGHIGDVFGRKKALITSIIGMAFATSSIGLIPSYDEIGFWAPALLVAIRLIQGVCIGGEGAGSAVFILEHLDGYKPGLIGSIVMASNMMGTLIATFVGVFISQFFDYNPQSWRYAFLLGGVMGIAGLYLRYGLSETPIFNNLKYDIEYQKKKKKLPILRVLEESWASILLITFLAGVATATAYIIRAYINIFFIRFHNFSPRDSLLLTSMCLIAFILLLPGLGIISDKIGYKKMIIAACISIISLSFPIFYLLSCDNLPSILLGLLLLSVIAALISAPAYPYAIESFTPSLRYSGIAFSWNTGNAIFGGTSPAIAAFLAGFIGETGPSFYLIFISCTFLLVSALLKRVVHT